MRIGILTLPLHTNYGGILQAYALQTVLERMENNVEVLGSAPRPPHISPLRHALSISKRLLQRYVLGKDVDIDRIKASRVRTIQGMKFTKDFINAHIHQRIIDNLDEISPNDYDAIVVGSDQIWRKAYFINIWNGQRDEDVFLEFTRGWNIKRLSYAASFGTDEIEVKGKHLQACRQAIAEFDAVSVREERGVAICKNDLGVDAVWMPDPTLLLNKSDYESLIPNFTQEQNGHILMSYILDETPEKAELRTSIATDKGLEINITNKVDNWKEGQQIIPQPPVEEWLRAFAESEYVITDSFHACVFSILFHKQFTVIANKGRGIARFTSLLKMFGLEDRLIFSPSEYKPLPDIDYKDVDTKLDAQRKRAYAFLNNNLN